MFEDLLGSRPRLLYAFEGASLLLLEQWDSVVHLQHLFLDLDPWVAHLSNTVRENLRVTGWCTWFLSQCSSEGVEALYRFRHFIIIFFNRGKQLLLSVLVIWENISLHSALLCFGKHAVMFSGRLWLLVLTTRVDIIKGTQCEFLWFVTWATSFRHCCLPFLDLSLSFVICVLF